MREFKSETGVFKDEATLALEKELKSLKKRLKDAEMERDILKKQGRLPGISIFSKSDR
ncbi:hypothetical protein R9C00_12240 [Flammeovirgaceae bacterium SG7u.111]|nr:hypothetical protein [Flammeovirgaceae bacterium SG7u.132]WPO38222.1 hypothetical protein R9C00_12240 [Flammeovirgaceae bacterium SG7u.111]